MASPSPPHLVLPSVLLLIRCVTPYPPPYFLPTPLGHMLRLRRLEIQRVCGSIVCRIAEVTVKALPWSPSQEGATVLELAPAHLIRALELVVSEFTGLDESTEHETG